MKNSISRWLVLFGLVVYSSSLTAQQQFYHNLRNGMRLGPGVPGETDSLSTNAFQRGGGQAGSKPIGFLDDGLRLTHHNQSRAVLLRIEESTAPADLQLALPSEALAVRVGDPPPISGISQITQFNAYGRRYVSFQTARGEFDVLQGITLLSPRFAKLEILRWDWDRFALDTRMSTSSIPAPKLREILNQYFDLTNSNDWLRMVSFYTQAERYAEARQVMEEALKLFPSELAQSRVVVEQLVTLQANQLFEEIKLRKRAAQHLMAKALLEKLPNKVLPIETQVSISDEMETLKNQVVLISEVAVALKEHVAKLPEPDQQTVGPLIDEILAEVTLETANRLADFQRLRNDATLPNESKVALAISGWLLGPGAGLSNFQVAKSLSLVRALVKEYLDDANQPRRQQIISQLRGQEGATPEYVDLLLEYMKPPQDTPQPEPDSPGHFKLSVITARGETVPYSVQVPPEYDPNHKYPCVLALPGRSETPEWELQWWCGREEKLPSGATTRLGQATRYGYIVVSPDWMEPTQGDYQYTEAEHNRILKSLRDAFRRFAIDTDRVFVSGHREGATAAWDLGVSHPDLWAGAVMISPGCDKYIVKYRNNIQGDLQNAPLGMYLVYGDLDGSRFDSLLGSEATEYLSSPRYDCLAVIYRGRGRERFAAELPRIMEWMDLSSHRRVRAPRDINASTMRSGDRFFYWLEAPAIQPSVASNPFQYDGKQFSAGQFSARRLEPTHNGVNISKIPSINKATIVWLTPEMVDFSRKIQIKVGTKNNRFDLSPSIAVMLEDVRQRGDRKHVFWQKVPIQ